MTKRLDKKAHTFNNGDEFAKQVSLIRLAILTIFARELESRNIDLISENFLAAMTWLFGDVEPINEADKINKELVWQHWNQRHESEWR